MANAPASFWKRKLEDFCIPGCFEAQGERETPVLFDFAEFLCMVVQSQRKEFGIQTKRLFSFTNRV